MEAEPKRKRRRFQFRLRTLLIGVTLLAALCWWVEIQRQLIRERQALLDRIIGVDRGNYFLEPLPPGQAPSISWLRRLLGDRAIDVILLPISADANEYGDIHRLFPEATLQVLETVKQPPHK